MLWPTVSVVGFTLMTALVIVLARSRTARWERDRVRPRRARAPVPPGRGPEGAPRLRTRLAGSLARTAGRARTASGGLGVALRRPSGATQRALVWATGIPALRRRLTGGPDAEPPAEPAPEPAPRPAVALPSERPAGRRGLRGRVTRPRAGRAPHRLRRRFPVRFRLRQAARRTAPPESVGTLDEAPDGG